MPMEKSLKLPTPATLDELEDFIEEAKRMFDADGSAEVKVFGKTFIRVSDADKPKDRQPLKSTQANNDIMKGSSLA